MDEDFAHGGAPDVPAPGCVLGGRYKIGRVLRSGGMGTVYEAEHTATGRRVAVKLVHLRSPALAELKSRFEREARIASNVQSKHIVQVFDAGRDELFGPFIAMELLLGEDLEGRLARAGPLPASLACEVAFQAARGLEKAHAASIAHRDLKPGNIFLVESDEEEFLVKVLDFGIAKLLEEDEQQGMKLTREGLALGTPLYMSPEQARGRTDVDERTDIYSLGAVLYEMIVGRSHVPELENYNQLVVHIATVPAPRVSQLRPDIDPRIDRLVADMLIADRRDRLQSMRLVRERIATILGMTTRQRLVADASGSFPAGKELRSSARLVSARPVPLPPDDADSEEVLFFERSSAPPPLDGASALGAARSTPEDAAPDPPPTDPTPAELAPPDSAGQAIVVFDRASLHLPAVTERTSSGTHVLDPRPSVPVFVDPAPPEPDPPRPAPLATKRRAAPRRTVLLTAAALATAFIALGSVRLVLQEGDGASARGAAAGGADAAAAPVAAEVPITAATAAATDAAPDGSGEIVR